MYNTQHVKFTWECLDNGQGSASNNITAKTRVVAVQDREFYPDCVAKILIIHTYSMFL